MGKSTIFMVIFNSFLYVYQRVPPKTRGGYNSNTSDSTITRSHLKQMSFVGFVDRDCIFGLSFFSFKWPCRSQKIWKAVPAPNVANTLMSHCMANGYATLSNQQKWGSECHDSFRPNTWFEFESWPKSCSTREGLFHFLRLHHWICHPLHHIPVFLKHPETSGCLAKKRCHGELQNK